MSARPEQRLLDEIDELVDWQLQQESSGYDHNINQPSQCRCGEDWHALPITSDLNYARLCYRMTGLMPEEYDYTTDTSTTLCPGSEVEGPILRPNHRIEEAIAFYQQQIATVMGIPVMPATHLSPFTDHYHLPPSVVDQDVRNSTYAQLVVMPVLSPRSAVRITGLAL